MHGSWRMESALCRCFSQILKLGKMFSKITNEHHKIRRKIFIHMQFFPAIITERIFIFFYEHIDENAHLFFSPKDDEHIDNIMRELYERGKKSLFPNTKCYNYDLM